MANETESVVIRYQINGAQEVIDKEKQIANAAKVTKIAIAELQAALANQDKLSKAFGKGLGQQAKAEFTERSKAQKAFEDEQRARATAYRAEIISGEKAFVKEQTAIAKAYQTEILSTEKALRKEQNAIAKASHDAQNAEFAAFEKEQRAIAKAAFSEQGAADKAFKKELVFVAKENLEERDKIQRLFEAEQRAKAKAYHQGILQAEKAHGAAITAQVQATAKQIAAVQAVNASFSPGTLAAARAARIAGIRAAATAGGAGTQLPTGPGVAQGVFGAPKLGLAGSLINAYFGVTAVKAVGELADKFLELRNRISLVTDSTSQAQSVIGELLNIANRSRSSLEATAQLYQRLATSVQGVAIKNSELLRVTESISKAATIGGSNALEQEKGLFQLSQALSSNQLRADELRSVLEQLPGVADVIAERFTKLNGGTVVTRQGLRALAAEGKITAKEIVIAFLEAEKSINEKFAKTASTVGQAFQVLRNNLIAYFGEVNQKTNVLSSVAAAILLIGKNIDFVARVVIATTLAKSITLIGGLLRSLAIAENGSLLIGITKLAILAGSAIFAFGDKIKVAGSNATVLDVIAVAFERIAAAVNSMRGFEFPELPNLPSFPSAARAPGLQAVGGFLDYVPSFFKSGAKGAANAVDAPGILTEAEARRRNINFQSDYERQKQELLFPNYLEKDLKNSGLAANAAKAKGNKKTFADYLTDYRGELEVLKEQGRERQTLAGLAKVQKALGRDLAVGETEVLSGVLRQIQAQRELNTLKEFKKNERRTRQLSRLGGDDADVQAAVFQFADQARINDNQVKPEDRSVIENQVRRTNEVKRYEEVLRSLGPTQAEFLAEERAITRAFDEKALSLSQYLIKLDELGLKQLASATDFESGIKRGLLEVDRGLQDVASSASNLVVSAFDQATDAILEFVKTGKLSVEDLVTDILSQLARLAIQQAITKPLMDAFRGYFNPTQTPAVATTPGLDPTINNPGLSPDLTPYNSFYRSTVAQQQGPQVIVENYNQAPGARSEVQQSTGPNGEKIIKILTRAVAAQLTEDTGMGGGLRPMLKQQGVSGAQGVHR